MQLSTHELLKSWQLDFEDSLGEIRPNPAESFLSEAVSTVW